MSRREEVANLMTEHELYNALDEGLQCAELAAKRMGYNRQEGRWFQVGVMLETIRQKCSALRRANKMPPLVDTNGMRMN